MPPAPLRHRLAVTAATAVAAIAATAAGAPAPAATAADAPAPAASGTTLATEQMPTPVSAWRGDVVYSAFDPAGGRYTLMRSHDGATPMPLPVPPSPRPFDVDLGTNTSGSPYAVYSRCAGPGATGCDLYRLGLDGGTETKLTALSSPTEDETDPTIFRGRIAFIRHERDRDALRISPSGGATATRTLATATHLSHPELGVATVAYHETAAGDREALRIVGTDGHGQRRIALEPGGDHAQQATRLVGPTLTDSARSYVWAQTGTAAPQGQVGLFEYRIASRRTVPARGADVDPNWASIAWAGGALGLVTSADLYGGCYAGTAESPADTVCAVRTTGTLAFGR